MPTATTDSDESKHDAESQLHHARLVRDASILNRFPITRVAFRKRVRAVVRMIEQVVHLEDAVDAPAASDPEAPLKPRIHTVDRQADEVVARHDAAVRTQAGPIAPAVGRREALARAVEIQPAQLEPVPDIPD